MVKRMVIMLIVVGLVLGGVFGFQAFKSKMIAQALAGLGNQPQTVSTTVAELQDWQPHLTAVGSFRAVNGADLALEVAGIVDQISFNSGDDVAAGAVLLQLRAADDIGRLRSLEATAELASINYERDQKQLKVQAISQAILDTDAANLKSARAQVVEQKAIVDKKTVRAPFAGRLGIRTVDLGQYLSAGATIVTLQALDPIYADFFLPQQNLATIKEGQQVTATIDTFPGQSFTGEISAINPKVDPATRNVQVRATFKNPDRKCCRACSPASASPPARRNSTSRCRRRRSPTTRMATRSMSRAPRPTPAPTRRSPRTRSSSPWAKRAATRFPCSVASRRARRS